MATVSKIERVNPTWHSATYRHNPTGECRSVMFKSAEENRQVLKDEAYDACEVDTLFHLGETAFGNNGIITMISLDGNAW